MTSGVSPQSANRLGFHYFPDTHHYTESDLRTWLPELRAFGAQWLTLLAPPDRAIPEPFISGLLQSGIQPLLHFALPPAPTPDPAELGLLFTSYARWGVRYAILFDRPNCRASWQASAWAQADLVERFLDAFIPLAETALQAGLTPVFPPLEPGGDYWDTSFLLAALKGIQRRGRQSLFERLALSAHARTNEHSLLWGAGGPERWAAARPYYTPEGQQDQRGFYIFDWYLAIAQAVLPQPPEMILLSVGSRLKSEERFSAEAITRHTEENLALFHLVRGDVTSADEIADVAPLPPPVIACNFWLLAASADSPHAPEAWFQPNGSTLPIVGVIRQWESEPAPETTFEEELPLPTFDEPLPPENPHPIEHYLLLPLYDWGVVEWHLDVIRPFVLRHHPTVGFSLAEAMLAQRVTVVGGEGAFSDAELEKLRRVGCSVERISGDGTSIATQLEVL